MATTATIVKMPGEMRENGWYNAYLVQLSDDALHYALSCVICKDAPEVQCFAYNAHPDGKARAPYFECRLGIVVKSLTDFPKPPYPYDEEGAMKLMRELLEAEGIELLPHKGGG